MKSLYTIANEAFEKYADSYDTESDEWLDLSVNDTYIAGYIEGMNSVELGLRDRIRYEREQAVLEYQQSQMMGK